MVNIEEPQTEFSQKDRVVSKVIEQQNSCEVNVNAKGQYSFKLKAYDFTLEAAIKKVLAHAKYMEVLIKEKNDR